MHQKTRAIELVELRARAATLMRQASETSDAWFGEQLRQLAIDLTEYANILEVEATCEQQRTDDCALEPVREEPPCERLRINLTGTADEDRARDLSDAPELS
jgi:hypothetical protein